jgi:hypothetical protein
MTPSPEVLLLQGISALAIALASAWITVKLSLRRFRAERQWDRKVQAYERLIEALHKSKKFSSEHLDAIHRGREVEDERDVELRKLAREARDEIRRAADIGSFTLSPKTLEIIATYESNLGNTSEITMWHDYLEHDYDVTSQCLKDLLVEAKRDLEGEA